jgi:hypothetical protein
VRAIGLYRDCFTILQLLQIIIIFSRVPFSQSGIIPNKFVLICDLLTRPCGGIETLTFVQRVKVFQTLMVSEGVHNEQLRPLTVFHNVLLFTVTGHQPTRLTIHNLHECLLLATRQCPFERTTANLHTCRTSMSFSNSGNSEPQ